MVWENPAEVSNLRAECFPTTEKDWIRF